MTRTVEVFTGAYASGKSETSINRALQYVKAGKSITLVDLDTVEPAYCMRPILGELKNRVNLLIVCDRFWVSLKTEELM